MSETLLRAHGIAKRFGGIDALKGVDLEIRPGEVVALIGENGADKSTMAKIIAGVEQPDSGTLEWEGAPVAFPDTRDAAQAGIAIVMQELSLIPDLSVAENIFLVHRDAYRGGWFLDRGAINRATHDLAPQHAARARRQWEHPRRPYDNVSGSEQRCAGRH
jgi:ribose transport system ATP-binding protein